MNFELRGVSHWFGQRRNFNALHILRVLYKTQPEFMTAPTSSRKRTRTLVAANIERLLSTVAIPRLRATRRIDRAHALFDRRYRAAYVAELSRAGATRGYKKLQIVILLFREETANSDIQQDIKSSSPALYVSRQVWSHAFEQHVASIDHTHSSTPGIEQPASPNFRE